MSKSSPRLLPMLALLSVMVVISDPSDAGDFGQWQYEQLVRPNEAQLAMEQQGRVNIYDGLRESDVDWALDTQFERIDSMMFVRTIRVTEAGELEMDSDCD